MDTYNDVWEAVLEYCKTKASSTGYKLWIADAEIKDFKNNTFILCLSSPLKKKIVMEYLTKRIRNVIPASGQGHFFIPLFRAA